jgi:hypothetical protein
VSIYLTFLKLETRVFCCIQGEVARACEGRAPWVAVKGNCKKLIDRTAVMVYHARAQSFYFRIEQQLSHPAFLPFTT